MDRVRTRGERESVVSTLVQLVLLAASTAPAVQGAPVAALDDEALRRQIEANVEVLLRPSAEWQRAFERLRAWAGKAPEGFDLSWNRKHAELYERWVLAEYPSTSMRAHEARQFVLHHGIRSVPIALEALERSSAGPRGELGRTLFATRLLEELAAGHFDSKAVQSSYPDVTVNTLWGELWKRTADDPSCWSPRCGLDEAKIPRTAEPIPHFVECEAVLSPGTEIRATNSTGNITITADLGFKRTYHWHGASRWVVLTPRESRSDGSLGLHHPGNADHWRDHKGVTRGVLEEGQQHFPTIEKARAWIEQQRKTMPLVYRGDGLAVGWRNDPLIDPLTGDTRRLTVHVWQVTIAGKRPTELPGSDDEAIVVTRSPP